MTQQLVFNAYEISKEIDVSIAFETMNNRGKPLSALELLKNRLIYLSGNMPEPHIGDGKLLRKQINDAWAIVYHNLGRNEERSLSDDQFLGTHLWNYYHQKISGAVPTEDDKLGRFLAHSHHVSDPSDFLLRTYFTRKRLSMEDSEPLSMATLHQYASDLRESAQTYFKLSTPERSGYSDSEKISLERLCRLRGYEAGVAMLAVYRQEASAKQRASFLEAYERYSFCSSFKGRFLPPNNHRMPPLEIIKYIKADRKIEELIQYYNNTVEQMFKDYPLTDFLHDWTKTGNSYYGWRSVRYFLFEHELFLQEKSKTQRSKIDWADFSKEEFKSDYITVEHIYPQRARDHYWTERFSKHSTAQRTALRNSLGNLLALSVPKNSSVSNKPFPDKVGSLGSTVGYRFGSYSENDLAMLPDWTPQEILERGVRMLTFMEKRWRLVIGDRKQKIKALGLNFLEP